MPKTKFSLFVSIFTIALCSQYAGANDFDINDDGAVDAADVDELDWMLKTQGPGALFVCNGFHPHHELFYCWSRPDFNGDGVFDYDDICEFVDLAFDTVPGDVNLDGSVDATDLSILGSRWGWGGTYTQGDLNCDGVVDAADLNIIGLYWGYSN